VQIQPVDGHYIGLYPAYVHEHVVEDDGRSLGGVRVVCPPLWGTAISPMCLPATGIGGGGRTRDGVTTPTGLYCVPPIGASVLIAFFGGDLDTPIYLGGFWGKPGGQFEVPSSPKQSAPQGSPDAMVWDVGQWRFLLESGATPQFRIERIGNEDTAIDIANDGIVTVRSKPAGGTESRIVIDGVSGTITIEGGTKIDLGATAMDALVKGTAFKTFFDAHIHNDPVTGVTSPPTIAMDATPGTHLSTKVNTE